MLLFRSVCHQVSNQADKLDLLAIFIINRRFAHLFKWASLGQSFLSRVKIFHKTRDLHFFTYFPICAKKNKPTAHMCSGIKTLKHNVRTT